MFDHWVYESKHWIKSALLSTWVRGPGSLTVAALVSKPPLLPVVFPLCCSTVSLQPLGYLTTCSTHHWCICWLDAGLDFAGQTINFCPQRWQQRCLLSCYELYPPVRSQWDLKSLLLPSPPFSPSPPPPLLPWLGFGAAQAVSDTGQVVQAVLGYLQLLWNCSHTTRRAIQWWVSLLVLE